MGVAIGLIEVIFGPGEDVLAGQFAVEAGAHGGGQLAECWRG